MLAGIPLFEEIDTIILGCTHYPIIQDYIESIVPENVKVVAQGEIVAERLEDYLIRHPEIEVRCTKKGGARYLTTENKDVFDMNANSFTGITVNSEQIKLV